MTQLKKIPEITVENLIEGALYILVAMSGEKFIVSLCDDKSGLSDNFRYWPFKSSFLGKIQGELYGPITLDHNT